MDGLTLRNVAGKGNSTNTVVDVGSSQEMTIDYAAGNGRSHHGRRALQLRAQGRRQPVLGLVLRHARRTPTSRTATSRQSWRRRPAVAEPLKNLYDNNASIGGPIAKDKLWFYSSARFQRSENYIAGLWENKNAGDLTKWLYEADLDSQTSSFLKSNTVNTRLTWQA